MTYCCPDLEKLARLEEGGLGLVRVTNKSGTRFLLMYRKDWHVPIAEAGIQILFCPYCGTMFDQPFLDAFNSGLERYSVVGTLAPVMGCSCVLLGGPARSRC